jgi:hypothetical protein
VLVEAAGLAGADSAAAAGLLSAGFDSVVEAPLSLDGLLPPLAAGFEA